MAEENLLQVENLVKNYPVKKGLIFQKVIGNVSAVNNISFTINKGETLGVIGESGCGKTTLSRIIIGLEEADIGSVTFMGQNVSAKMPNSLRRNVQMVFQDPYASFNPRMSVRRILEEPLRIHHQQMPQKEKLDVIKPILGQVGLPQSALIKHPHEFSGGQRQRIGIARALVTKPKLLICDEPVSALDVSIQAQILNLFRDLQKELSLAYMFVSHDMSVVRHVSDRVLVMYLGQAVELASKKKLFEAPMHPYTKTLMEAVPIPDPARANLGKIPQGEPPSPIELPKGCAFYTRCKHAKPMCKDVMPVLKQISPQHSVACHLYEYA